MFVTMNSVTIVAMAIVAIMTVCGIAINLKAMVHNKNINSRVMFIIMAIFAISIIVLICNIDYNKSAPVEVYTEEDITGSYNAGYDKGYEEAYATTEDWFSNLQSVTIGEDNSTIHLIDGNGEEWVLVSDDYQN